MVEHTDELRALRERAYGPDADIALDARAMSRLHELEALTRVESAPTAVSPPSAAAPRDAEVVWAAEQAEPVDDGAGEASADPEPSDERADADAAPEPPPDVTRRRWWARHVPLLWIGSVVVSVVLGALSATGIQALVTGRVAVLAHDDTAPWPVDFFGSQPAGGRVFDEFHGLLVLTVPQDFARESMTECIYVLATTPDGDRSMTTAGCAAGDFAATASLEVNDQFPDALRERYADGTALQFTLAGDEVVVAARG